MADGDPAQRFSKDQGPRLRAPHRGTYPFYSRAHARLVLFSFLGQAVGGLAITLLIVLAPLLERFSLSALTPAFAVVLISRIIYAGGIDRVPIGRLKTRLVVASAVSALGWNDRWGRLYYLGPVVLASLAVITIVALATSVLAN